jgi:hypothetical protein
MRDGVTDVISAVIVRSKGHSSNDLVPPEGGSVSWNR